MAVTRYITHGFVLLLALMLSGYASFNHGIPASLSLRLGAVNAEGLILGQGGQVGNVAMGRASVIVKPVAVPKSAAVSHTAVTYQVKDGETIKDLAARFNVTTDSIRWSNYSALKNTSKDVTSGQTIVVPPVNGLVVTTQQGDTPSSLASKYHALASDILDFNYLRTGEQDPIPPSTMIVIPGGRGPDFEQPVGVRNTVIPVSHGGNGGYSIVSTGGSIPVRSGNRFSFGECTYYVYNRRYVPWLGNAWQWYGNAQAMGYSTGQTPKVGAIMVTWESSWGHVGYVEAVNSDGSYTISEMNFVAFDTIDHRTIKPGGVPLIGFIY